MKNNNVLMSLIIAVGIGVSGWFIGWGFIHGRASDRYVTVKGVSEREATADVALWPIQFVSTDDDLGNAQTKIQESKEIIMTFLMERGFESSEVEVQRLAVNDLLTDPHRDGPVQSRYIIEQTLMVRTNECEKIEIASQAVDNTITS